jgi:dihydroorotase
MSLLLKNAFIVDSHSSKHSKHVDLLIEEGIISSFKGETANEIVDLQGKTVTPGWFDLNANFNDPGNEHKESISSGLQCASFGGFTDVNLSPDTVPPIESKSDVRYLKRRSNHMVDIHVTAGLSESLKGGNLNEILDLFSAGALSFSDGDQPIWNSELLLKALQYVNEVNAPVFQNARDKYLSSNTFMHEGSFSTQLGLRGEPSLSEVLMITRDLEILKYSGGKIHFSNVSTAESVVLIAKAKKEKLNVTCDVSIHHLLFCDSSISDFDTVFKVKPPYREESDRKALIEGVKLDVIDAICSYHRPQDQEGKQLEFDLAEDGNISLQTFYSSLLTISKEIPLEILIDRVTHGPRSVLGLENVIIEEGQKAKLSILDPNMKWKYDKFTNLSKSKNSPFWNQNLLGKVFGTVNSDSYLIH